MFPPGTEGMDPAFSSFAATVNFTCKYRHPILTALFVRHEEAIKATQTEAIEATQTEAGREYDNNRHLTNSHPQGLGSRVKCQGSRVKGQGPRA